MSAGADLSLFLAPLAGALRSETALTAALSDLGLLTGPSPVLAIPKALSDLADDVEAAIAALEALDSDDRPAAARLAAALEATAGVISGVRALEGALDGATDELAWIFQTPWVWQELAARLPGWLLERWLRDGHPRLHATLDALGAWPADPDRSGPDLDAVAGFLTDPTGHVRDLLVSRPELLVRPLTSLVAGLGWKPRPARLTIEDGEVTEDDEAELPWAPASNVSLVSSAAGAAWLLGAQVTLTDDGGVRLQLDGLDGLDTPAALAPGWTVEATAGGGGPLAVVLYPDGPRPDRDGITDTARIAFTGVAPTPWSLLGIAGGTRLELTGLTVRLDASALLTAPDLTATLATQGLRLVLVGAEGDSLVASLLGAAELAVDAALDATWSEAGLVLGGGAGFDVTVPLERAIGPVTVHTLRLALSGDTGGLSAEITSVLSVLLGPVELSLDQVGLAAGVAAAAGGALGVLAPSLGLRPPSGAGLGIDAGVVAGGGYLAADATGYSGVLELSALSVAISAAGILDTDPPDVDGWSLLLALFLRLPSIQLGFGFTLNGVGGLAGVNRTADTDALRAAITSGALGTVLFPADPIADAPVVIDQLRAIFPPAGGRTVFGPVARIGWGTPALVTADVGVVISLPDPITIAVLGSVTSVLPEAEFDLVGLHLDAAGVVDLGAGSLSLDAALHDSEIVGFALSGGMALRSDFLGSPAFLMAVGGFHPGFPPPTGFPDLDRLRVAFSAGDVLAIDLDCYVAIASNTVQFGAAFSLTAEVEGFGIDGGTEFDAVVNFRPFSIETELGCHVTVTAANLDVAGVWLEGVLTGPNPWHVTATAGLEILGVRDDLPIDLTIGAPRHEPDVPDADLLDQLRAALADPDAWSAVAGATPGVLLAANADEGLATTPDGTVGVAQRLVPLGVAIDRFGEERAGDYDLFTLEVGEGMASSGELTDWFAPAQLFDLAPAEALSAPSFELLPAGLAFGAGDPTAGPARAATLEFEQVVRDPELDEDGTRLPVLVASGALLAASASGIPDRGFAVSGDGGLAPVDPRFRVTDRDTGAERLTAPSWSACHQSSAGRRPDSALSPAWEAALR